MNKVASFFTGVGGIDLGFIKNGFEIVFANDIDKKACETYKLNFGDIVKEDISKLDIDKIPDFDILLAGFPCQSFSIAGYRKGFNDVRGNLFFDLLKIIEKKKPKIIFLENVKNLENHDNGNTFKVIKSALEQIGYKIKHKVLNSSKYGNIPQNRERIYILGFLNEKHYNEFEFPKKIELTKSIKNIINFNQKQEDKHYYINKRPEYYKMLLDAIDEDDTIYQFRRVYVRKNQSKLCPTLTANMGTGGHNVPIIKDNFGIRRLTPKECFSFQGFPDDYKLPNQADGHLYKQAGNSVVVNVIERIAKNLTKIL